MKSIVVIEKNSSLSGFEAVRHHLEDLASADAIYTENQGIRHLLRLDEMLELQGNSCQIFLKAPKYREAFLKAMVPRIVIVDEDLSPEEAYCYIQHYNIPMEEKSASFTASELRLMEELGYGLCNKELSERLNMSERTIRRYKTKLLEKTGLLSSEQLSMFCLCVRENPRILRS